MRKNQKNCEKQEKEEKKKRATTIPGNTDFWWQRKKSIARVTESVESGEISSSSSIWKTGLDKLFVTCVNIDRKNKLKKPIQNQLDLFINTNLNHMSIRSSLISQPKNKLFSNG